MGDSAFYIEKRGTWPTETYYIAPCAQIIDPGLGFLPAENMFRYLNNPINETNNLNSVTYNNAVYTFQEDRSQYAINTSDNASFVWNLSSSRKSYDVGPQFNYFYVNTNPGVDVQYRKYYSYLLYPTRLFLKPISLTKSNGSWTLSTSAVVTDTTTFFFYSSAPETEAYKKHLDFLSYGPTFSKIPSDGNTSIKFNLSSTHTYIDRPIINFSATNNPTRFSTILDSISGGYIRPDSTFISYNINYLDTNKNKTGLGQVLPEMQPNISPDFKSTFILNHEKLNAKQQIFQLLQYKAQNDNSFTNLNDSVNCVLSAVFNLSSTNLYYYSNFYVGPGYTLVNTITGSPGSSIKASYTVDCKHLQISKETWETTFNYFKINSVSKTLGSSQTSSSVRDYVIEWNTKYPPHYYSYQASVNSTNYSIPDSDTCKLTFNLVCSTIQLTPYTAKLSSYISSDFNLLKYNLASSNYNEYIKFELLSPPVIFSTGVIKCYYGPNSDQLYDILNPTWIPAASGQNFLISYPNAPYGEVDVTIRPTLSSAAGFLAAKNATVFSFAAGEQQYANGHPIFIEIESQGPGYMDVSAAMLTAAPAWPARDLRNSFISWSFYPPSVGAQIKTLNANNETVTTIAANSAVLFSSDTSRVRFDNIGFSTIVAILSSQKYNETASVSGVSGLFDPFEEGRFIIQPSVKLNNLNRTRTISLTAGLPYQGNIYPIPIGTNVAWKWTYNYLNKYAEKMPIKAYYGANKTPYEFGTPMVAEMLSSIHVEVTPGESDIYPPLNSVKLFLMTFDRDPFIDSYYEFFVDDFPSRNLLNTDFSISYTNFTDQPSATILDTSLNQFTLARPNDGTNVFTLSSKSNSNLSPLTTYVWSISDNAIGRLPDKYVFFKDHQLNHTISPGATYTIITLSALSAMAAGWFINNILENADFATLPYHNVSTSVTVFTPPSEDFHKKLEIIAYPEYVWNGGRYLTLLNSSNYSLCQAPTAFENKTSNSQNYFLSANKPTFFDDYDYYFTSQKTFLSSVSSTLALLEIPYHTEYFSSTGLNVSLSAYGIGFPSYNTSLEYIKPNSTSIKATLQTYTYQSTASLVPAYSTNLSNKLTKNLKSKPYDLPTFSFVLCSKTIDLDYYRNVSLYQSISTDPVNSPCIPVLNQGTIVYALSSDFWVTTITLPAQTGLFNAFNLNVGDPYELGYVSNSKTNRLAIKPLAINIPMYIPPTTFDPYNSTQWPGDRNLWNVVTFTKVLSGKNDQPWQTFTAYNTSVPPEAFLSTNIAVTGQNIYVEYTVPSEKDDKFVLFYRTNFGESDEFTISQKNEPVTYQYKSDGTFFISYEAHYYDGSTSYGIIPDPIVIKSGWSVYNQETIRTLAETTLLFPYNFNQIEIQPNEWGTVDIFNTAITRLYDNLMYIQNNVQSINTDSPTVYYGWLGTCVDKKSFGIRWYTKSFGSTYYKDLTLACSNGPSYFTNIKDSLEYNEYLFTIDNNNLRVFLNTHYSPVELKFINPQDFPEEFVQASCFDVDETGTTLYVVDTPRNKVVCLEIDTETPAINVSVNVGGFGERNDPGKFNSPTDLIYADGSIYILDYNNKCVKEYTKDLNWIHTYFSEDFLIDFPIAITAQHQGMVYILTENSKVYVFEKYQTDPITIFDVSEVKYISNESPAKMIFDEAGEFIYISTDTKIFKYSAVGSFISQVAFNYKISSIKKAPNRNILISTPKAIVKIQDVVTLFKIGDGLPLEQWSLDQILLKKEEMPSDISYNRAFTRLTQNINSFRNNLNSRYKKITEQTSNGIISYFALVPISIDQKPSIEDDVLNNKVSVAANELHIPQVFNREFFKIYKSLDSIRDFLSIIDLSLPDLKIEGKGVSVTCAEPFCWSWKAMSCYKLSLPAIRICNINPITYSELSENFPLAYAPTKTWEMAESDCCTKTSII